ncbi:alpha-mannosidase [bacterium]
MKRIIILVLSVAILTLAAAPAFALHSELNVAVNKMEKLVFQPLSKWQMSPDVTKEEALNPKFKGKKFRKIGIGYFWADDQTIWMRTLVKVPEKILNMPVAGTKIGLSANIEDYGEIYVNGELKQKFRRSTGHITLTESAVPGTRYFIVIMARRKANDAGLIRNLCLDYEILEELELRTIGYTEAFQGMDTMLQVAGENPDDWQETLDSAGAAIDTAALKEGRLDDFYASLDKSDGILAPLTKIMKQYKMLLMGYSHIDLAWLWDRDEGKDVVWKGTSEVILDLHKDFPEFVYVANQMHGYRWMERDYPELFERIKADIKGGAWDPTGAEWAEPDGNIPHGESFVRQYLYGRKYSMEKFGEVSSVGLTPDSFGYNWNMPQILSKSDMRGFITQKISWNDTTRFPHNIFWWESPDGSRLLTFFPQGSYVESVSGGKMATELASMKKKHNVNANFVIWGIGDHGGGIPRDYVKRAYGLKDSPIYPEIDFVDGEKLYDWTEEQAETKEFPVWDTELYLEYHRGTYTTQSNTKNNNRRNEHCLMNAEKFASISSITGSEEYPFDKLEEAWKMTLFNQFHDILPGSSITPVYKDADEDYGWIAGECSGVIDESFANLVTTAKTDGEGQALVLFNGLSWSREGLVEVPLEPGVSDVTIYHEQGEEVPAQVIENSDGSKAAIFMARSVPAMGYAVYRMIEAKGPGDGRRQLSANKMTIENEFFKVTVDTKTGWVSGIYDKKNKIEIIEPGKFAFELQARKEAARSNAWDMWFDEGSEMEMPAPEEVKVIETGPVRATIAVRRKFAENDEFTHYYSLVEGVPIVFGRLDAEWHDRNIFLKSAFHFNLDADYATYEIPYANIKRTSKPETKAEKAQWEVSGHRWVDYTDKKKDYGVTLLSFSKYGYDTVGSVLRMTMLRSPTAPDPTADDGFHSIPYALYPHKGGWEAADSALRGREYNDPIMVIKAEAGPGTLGVRHSFFSARPDNVVISTIKRAENGEGFVIRMIETEGRDGEVVIELPAAPKKVVETNLVERDLVEIPVPEDNTLKLPIGHYEIKSVRVVF